MIKYRTLLKTWQLQHHVVSACLCTLALTIFCWWIAQVNNSKVDSKQQELSKTKSDLYAAQNLYSNKLPVRFTENLPKISKSDEVVHDISKQAQDLNIQIASLNVTHFEPSNNELRKLQFNLTAVAEYRAFKNWLSELLWRYPSMGTQNISMRALPNDTGKQETQVVLVFYVRD